MDVLEAIRNRKSIRAYKPDPVPKEVLRELIEVSLRAPSYENSQPWEFTIVGGEVMEKLKSALVEKLSSGEAPHPDIPLARLPEIYRERGRQLGRTIFQILGIAREDRERRFLWNLEMMKFFNAPNGIIIYVDRSLGPWSLVDVGIVLQTIMLAALGYGLGTCPEAAVVQYPEVLRDMLNIPESKQIICGIAIGYPDWDAPINNFRSNREPVDRLVTWQGI